MFVTLEILICVHAAKQQRFQMVVCLTESKTGSPAPAQSATAQDFANMFDVLKRYVIDLDKTMRSGDAAIPTSQPDDIPTPENTEEVEANFTKPLRIEDLAERAKMSPSSFHHHFKQVTSMSPLRYQKQLRLIEARRLMLTEQSTAVNAADRVGYESPAQFSREYARMFGAPPIRDLRTVS